ncbi:translation machinery-associated protein 16 [Onthophagus taurus]|uniref:translation machinery-associated protein 16 n=1 Tax=Onthophagus taurus TaxID=166361 RepID=UPI000C202309|nr:translation machinery-associated protein 16 [Onthophagus taurus]
MPSNNKQLTAKHPNSRQVISMAKKQRKKIARNTSKFSTIMKQTLIGEKLSWFQVNLLPDKIVYTKEETKQAIEVYLSRFNAELEAIRSKQNIGSRKNQVNKREEVIKMTLEREIGDYNSGGLEIPDLMNEGQFKLLKEWDGDLKYLSLFKLKRYSKKCLN